MNPRIDEDGSMYWLNERGQLHKENGPAIERANGDKVWYINGRCHRKDGPAREFVNGSKLWYWKDFHCTLEEYVKLNPSFLTNPNFLIYCL